MTVEPFGIKTKDLTYDQVADVINKSVTAGAALHEGLKGYHKLPDTCTHHSYTFVGVDVDNDTYFSDGANAFSGNIIELKDLDEHLGINVIKIDSDDTTTKQQVIPPELQQIILDTMDDGALDLTIKNGDCYCFVAHNNDESRTIYSWHPDDDEFVTMTLTADVLDVL